MPAPLIGVTTSNITRKTTRTRWVGIPKAYTRAVVEAGGVPVLIPTNFPIEEIAAL